MSSVGAADISARTLTYANVSVPPFGIYQLTIPEWQAYAHETLIDTQQSVRAYVEGLPLPEGSADRFEINDTYALTYVERRDTKDREDLVDVRFSRVLDRIGNLSASSDVVAVPIGELEWRASHIVAPFDQESAEYKRLLDQQAVIDRILRDAGMEEPPVNRPHHTSLSGIQFRLEAAPLHTRIFRNHRKAMLQMIGTRLTAAGIDSVELGEVIVGKNYTSPFSLGNWLMSRCTQTEFCGELLAG